MIINRKVKKKKLNHFIQNKQKLTKDQQEIATQNLFNFSNYEDHLNNRNQLTHQSDIFNSIVMLDKPLGQICRPKIERNVTKFSENKKNKQHVQLVQLMDKQFIRESKLMLKLYSTIPDSYQSHQQTKKQSAIIKKTKPQRQLVLCNTFQSDSVFVAKKKYVTENSVISQAQHSQMKLLSKNKKKQTKSNSNNLSKINQSLQKSPSHILSVYTSCQRYCNNPERQRHLSNIRAFSPNNFIKSKFLEYDKISKLKTLNDTSCYISRNSFQFVTGANLTQDQNKLFRQTHSLSLNTKKMADRKTSFKKRNIFFRQHKKKSLSSLNNIKV